MKTGTWPADQIIQYSTMMFCHNIMKSGHKRVARKILVEQTKQKSHKSYQKNTMISKLQKPTQEIGVKIKNVENMNKSK